MPYTFTAEVNLRLNAGSLRAVQQQLRDGLRGASLDPSALRQVQAYTDALRAARSHAVGLDQAGRGLNATLSNSKASAAALAREMTGANEAAARTAKGFAQVREGSAQAASSMDAFAHQAGLAARRYAAFALASGTMMRVAAEIKTAVAEAVKFDREVVRLQQVSEDASQKIRGLAAQVGNLSAGFGVSSAEMIKAATLFKQAGLSVDDTAASMEALAKAALAPNFDSLAQTAEGAIAIFRQFKLSGKDLEGALGSVNAVAGAFAVEAGDLIEVVRRTGGVFASLAGDVKPGRDALNELLALFTSVRGTTREDASVISTGLKTIFTRVQRPETVEALKSLGVQLRFTREELEATGRAADLEGRFVGTFEAVRRLSQALRQIPETDPQFASIVEQLGGVWQIGRVIPLIKEFGEAQKALAVAQAGQTSLAANAAQAQQALSVQIVKAKENWLQLGRTLSDTQGFRTGIGLVLSLSNSLAKLLEYAGPLIPALTALATIKLGQAFAGAASAFAFDRAAGTRPTASDLRRRAAGGPVGRFAAGGIVPGVGTGDKVPAVLEPGEVVVPRHEARRKGWARLASGGRVRFADGGYAEVKQPGPVGLLHLQEDGSGHGTRQRVLVPWGKLPATAIRSFQFGLSRDQFEAAKRARGLTSPALKLSTTALTRAAGSRTAPPAERAFAGEALDRFFAVGDRKLRGVSADVLSLPVSGQNRQKTEDVFQRRIEEFVEKTAVEVMELNQLGNYKIAPRHLRSATRKIGQVGRGVIFDSVVSAIGRQAGRPNDVFDLPGAIPPGVRKMFGATHPGLNWADLKVNASDANAASVVRKALTQFGLREKAGSAFSSPRFAETDPRAVLSGRSVYAPRAVGFDLNDPKARRDFLNQPGFARPSRRNTRRLVSSLDAFRTSGKIGAAADVLDEIGKDPSVRAARAVARKAGGGLVTDLRAFRGIPAFGPRPDAASARALGAEFGQLPGVEQFLPYLRFGPLTPNPLDLAGLNPPVRADRGRPRAASSFPAGLRPGSARGVLGALRARRLAKADPDLRAAASLGRPLTPEQKERLAALLAPGNRRAAAGLLGRTLGPLAADPTVSQLLRAAVANPRETVPGMELEDRLLELAGEDHPSVRGLRELRRAGRFAGGGPLTPLPTQDYSKLFRSHTVAVKNKEILKEYSRHEGFFNRPFYAGSFGGLSAAERKRIGDLSREAGRHVIPPGVGPLFRGVSGEGLDALLAQLGVPLGDPRGVGRSFVTPQFLSATTRPEIARNFGRSGELSVLRILNAAGRRGVGGFNYAEQEVLFRPGRRLRVEGFGTHEFPPDSGESPLRFADVSFLAEGGPAEGGKIPDSVYRLLERHGYGSLDPAGLFGGFLRPARNYGFYEANSGYGGVNPWLHHRDRRPLIDTLLHESSHAASAILGARASGGERKPAYLSDPSGPFGKAQRVVASPIGYQSLFGPKKLQRYQEFYKGREYLLPDEAVATAFGLAAGAHAGSPHPLYTGVGKRLSDEVFDLILPALHEAASVGPLPPKPGSVRQLQAAIAAKRLATGGRVDVTRVGERTVLKAAKLLGTTPERLGLRGVTGLERAGTGLYAGSGYINLNPLDFSDPATASFAAAHELGHAAHLAVAGDLYKHRRGDLLRLAPGVASRRASLVDDLAFAATREKGFVPSPTDAADAAYRKGPRELLADLVGSGVTGRALVPVHRGGVRSVSLRDFPGAKEDAGEFMAVLREALADPKGALARVREATPSSRLGRLLGFASGGEVPRGLVPGVGNSDSVPLDLPVGSYVIRKASVERLGRQNLAALSGRSGFASGGPAETIPALVMPGEWIFGPDEAGRIGRPALDRLNRYASGGAVARTRFETGGVGLPAREIVLDPGELRKSGSELRKALFEVSGRLQEEMIAELTKTGAYSERDAGVVVADRVRRAAGPLPGGFNLALQKDIASQIRASTGASDKEANAQAAKRVEKLNAELAYALEARKKAEELAAKAAEGVTRASAEEALAADLKAKADRKFALASREGDPAKRTAALREGNSLQLQSEQVLARAARIREGGEAAGKESGRLRAEANDLVARNAFSVSTDFRGNAVVRSPLIEAEAAKRAGEVRVGRDTLKGVAEQRVEDRTRRVAHLLSGESKQALVNDEVERLRKEYVRAASRQIQSLDKSVGATEARRIAEERFEQSLKNNSLRVRRNARGEIDADLGITDAKGDVAPQLGLLGRTKAGLRNAFRGGLDSNASIALSIAAPVITDAIRPTDVEAVARGGAGAGSFVAGSAAAGATSLGLTGAVVGQALGKGLTGFGVGAVIGLAQGIQDASRQINEAKLGLAVQKAADELSLLAQGFKDFGPGSADLLRTQDAEIRERNLEKAKNDSTFLLFFRRSGDTRKLAEDNDRVEFNKQAVGRAQLLNQRIERVAAGPGGRNLTPREIVEQTLDENGGFFRQQVPRLARARGVSEGEFRSGLAEQAADARQRVLADAANREAAKAAATAAAQLESLAQAARGAVAALEASGDGVKVLRGLLDGSPSGVGFDPIGRKLSSPGFGPGDLGQAVGSVADFLAPDRAKSLRGDARAVEIVSRELPGAITAAVAARAGSDRPVDFAKIVSDRLRESAGGFSDDPAFKRALALVGGTFSGEKFEDALGRAGGDPSKLVRDTLSAVSKSLEGGLRDVAEALTRGANEYIGGLRQAAQDEARVRDEQGRLAELGLAAERRRAGDQAVKAGRLRESGIDLLTADQMKAPFEGRQKALAGDIGLDPARLGARLAALRPEVEQARGELNLAVLNRGKEGGEERFRKAAERFASLEGESQRVVQALRGLADATAATAGQMEKLQRLQQEEEGRLSLGERILGEGAGEKSRRRRGERLLQDAARGNFRRLRGRNADLFLEASRLYENVPVAEGGPTGAEVRRNQIRQQVPQANLPAGKLGERDRLEGEVTDATVRAQLAQQELLSKQLDTLGEIKNLLAAQQDLFLRGVGVEKAADAERVIAVGRGEAEARKARFAPVAGGLDDIGRLFGKAGGDLTADELRRFSTLSDLPIAGQVREYAGKLSEREVLRQQMERAGGIRSAAGGTKLQLDGKDFWFSDALDLDPSAALKSLTEANAISPETAGRAETIFKSFRNKNLGNLPDAIRRAAEEQFAATTDPLNKSRESLEKVGLVDAAGKGPVDLLVKELSAGTLKTSLDGLVRLAGVLKEGEFKDKSGADIRGVAAATDKSLAELADEAKKAAAALAEVRLAFALAAGGAKDPDAARKALAAGLASVGVGGFAAGGVVAPGGSAPWARPRGRDTVPAMLTPEEFVVNPESSKANRGLLERINRARGPVYLADGGFARRGMLDEGEFKRINDALEAESVAPAPRPVAGKRLVPGLVGNNVPLNLLAVRPGVIFDGRERAALRLLNRPTAFPRLGGLGDLADSQPGGAAEQSLLAFSQAAETRDFENRKREIRANIFGGADLPPAVRKRIEEIGRSIEGLQEQEQGRALVRGAASTANLASYALSGLGEREILGLGRTGITAQRQMEARLFAQARETNFRQAVETAGAGDNPRLLKFLANTQTDKPLRRAGGGPVPGRGRGDHVPALLEPGEFVLKRAAVARAGVAAVQRFNDGGPVRHFADGGPVPFHPAFGGVPSAPNHLYVPDFQKIPNPGTPKQDPKSFDAAVEKFLRPVGDLAKTVETFGKHVGRFEDAVRKLDEALGKFDGTVKVEGTQVVQHTGTVAVTGGGGAEAAGKLREEAEAVFKRRAPDYF